MLAPLTRSYGLGFTRVVSDLTTVLSNDPDAEVVSLFDKMTSSGVGTTNWPFVRAVILCAKRMFGPDVRGWFESQSTNEKLSENARGFLNDTIAYINSGQRPVSITGRIRVLTREQQLQNVLVGPGHIDVIADLSAHPITQWLRQPGGLTDLVFTLNVLFGKGING